MNSQKYYKFVMSIAVVFTMSGCASITGSTTQNISIQTREASGKEVSEAKCELINKKGTYFVTTPGTITISRSNDDLQLTCRKDGFENGRAGVVSDTKGSMFGNIVLGGGIGAIIDHNNGSAYEYPSFVQVVMGAFTNIGKVREEQKQSPTSPLGKF
ncbi:hypothetical protein [Methylophilus sp.]|uniref:hypothetical protein n=1 Tax=Methylophilus sp. TaxID=29541 RepID=UPI0011D95647|nr:hypothetical protein [Methylophilus sp.]TXI44169.1 MAG: hypothetical protein E6Q52_09915 [Methylophilus sp.]